MLLKNKKILNYYNFLNYTFKFLFLVQIGLVGCMLFVSFYNLYELFHIISKNNSILSFFFVIVECQPFNEHEVASLKGQIYNFGRDFALLNTYPGQVGEFEPEIVRNMSVSVEEQFRNQVNTIVLYESTEGSQGSCIDLLNLEIIERDEQAIIEEYIIDSPDMSYSYGCQLINRMDQEMVNGIQDQKPLISYTLLTEDQIFTNEETDCTSLIAEISRKGSRCCHYALSLLRDAKKNNNINSFTRADSLYKKLKKKYDILTRIVRRIERLKYKD